MAKAIMTSSGRLVIPKSVREHLLLQPGDRVNFVIQDNGDVVIRTAGIDVLELKGLLHRPHKPVSVAQMNEAIRNKMARNV